MPVDLRSVVPIVPTGLPDNRSHHNAAWIFELELRLVTNVSKRSSKTRKLLKSIIYIVILFLSDY